MLTDGGDQFDAGEDHLSTSRGELTVIKSQRYGYSHPAIGFEIISEYEQPVQVELEEALPVELSPDVIGFPEEDTDNWTVHDAGAYLTYTATIPPNSEVSTLFGLQVRDIETVEMFLDEPHIVRLAPASDDKAASESLAAPSVELDPDNPLIEGPPSVSFDDVAGFTDVKQRLREEVLEPFTNPQFERYDIGRVNGVLLYGPPGTGKTYLAKALAGELGYHFLPVNPTTVVSSTVGRGVENLDDVFTTARDHQPCVVFFDELDAIAGERGSNMTQSQEQMVNTLLTEIADINDADEDILVVGATNAPDEVDSALKRTGRFDTTLKIGLPDADTRLAILEHTLTTRGPPAERFYISEAFQEQFIEGSQGLSASDVTETVEAAQRAAVREVGTDETPQVTATHVFDALDKVGEKHEQDVASEFLVESPDVDFDDVGGMGELKQQLRERVVDALQAPDRFETYGLTPPNGILLYGPPGTGKTHLSRTLAGEAGVTFLSITAADVTSKWVGEAAENVSALFERAIDVQPTILFIDELDAVAGERGRNQTNSESQMVNELLSGLTRIHDEDVIVIATTNRLDSIDGAVKRAGRMDETIEVPPPDGDARVGILKVQLRNRPVAWDDLAWDRLRELTAPERHAAPFVAADLAAIVDEAARLAMYENDAESGTTDTDDSSVTEIGMEHLEAAIERIEPSLVESGW